MSNSKSVTDIVGMVIGIAAIIVVLFAFSVWLTTVCIGALAANTGWDCAISWQGAFWLQMTAWSLGLVSSGAKRASS